jgi:uncharacterized protein YaiE (UPF0345 family)
MTPYRQLGSVLLVGALLLAGFAGQALALTAACTSIENKATLTFNYGGDDIILESSEAGNTTVGVNEGSATTFAVATKVDLTVTGGAIVTTIPGATDRVLTFSITNTGNDTQRYSLRLWAAANGYDYDGTTSYVDNFNVTNVRVFTDDDNDYSNGTLDEISAAAATDGSHLGYTANVAGNNGIIYVHVVADIPNNRANGDDAIYALQAVTHQITGRNGMNADGDGTADGGETDETYSENSCGSAIVLADGQATGTGPAGIGPGGVNDVAKNGDSFAVGVYTVSAAALTVTKTQTTLWDPINGNSSPKPIPGAYVTYTMTIANNGATSATLSAIVDDLQAELDLDFNLFTGADMDPSDGPYGGGSAGKSVEITARTATAYYTADGADNDGVAYTGNPGGVLTVYFTEDAGSGSVLPEDVPNSYAEGELKTGESVIIKFNVIIK